jgi:hypothetical protein
LCNGTREDGQTACPGSILITADTHRLVSGDISPFAPRSNRAGAMTWAVNDARVLMHGHLDSELDLVGDLEVERHIEECPQCAESDAGGPAESAASQIGISYARKAISLAVPTNEHEGGRGDGQALGANHRYQFLQARVARRDGLEALRPARTQHNRAPFAASWRAVPSPIPLDAPVMRTTLLFNPGMCP